jgi:hypothetical protein
LTGPDHLSALATLSVTEKSLRKTFFLGLQWGVGHSSGLMLVGIILISLHSSTADKNKEMDGYITFPSPHISRALESSVGVFMIGLGIYGIHRSRRKLLASNNLQLTNTDQMSQQRADQPYQENFLINNDSSPLQHNFPKVVQDIGFRSDDQIYGYGATVSKTMSSITPKNHTHMIPIKLYNSDRQDEIMISVQHLGEPNSLENSLNMPLSMSHIQCPICGSYSTTSFLALIAGIFHGVAGVGGILGVLPAVEMKNPLWGTIYLITFCICSTLTMGCFAMCYGHLFGHYEGLWEFRMECFSACLSVLVGILWIVLLSLGKMEDVFGD